ncbi:MAG TPA: radical SAM protein [Bacteroidales bacterium]|nr:radical SAM protein [Bacteroidales bacterium]
MGTFLFNSIVFGPVKSRRLGVSLGINLLPTNQKICSFDCIYCECGWTNSMTTSDFPSASQVELSLESKLIAMKESGELPDVITFAGNGEPTLHPEFPIIIDNTIALRNMYCPSAKIAVLSNSTLIQNINIFNSLLKVDQNILKLDSVFPETIEILNQPLFKVDISGLIDNLKRFSGRCTIQTLFVKGSFRGKTIDNTTDTEVNAWLKAIQKIKPKDVMIYTIARETPTDTLHKIPLPTLLVIARKVERIGIKTQVSG